MSKFIRGKALSYTEIACFSSHYRLWQKCVELDSPIVVIEDDVNFNSNFIDSLIDIYNSNIPYVRLICSFDRGIRHMMGNFYMSFSNISGTHGFLSLQVLRLSLYPILKIGFIALIIIWICFSCTIFGICFISHLVFMMI